MPLVVSIDFMRGVETIDEDKSNDVHSLSVMRIALVFFFLTLTMGHPNQKSGGNRGFITF